MFSIGLLTLALIGALVTIVLRKRVGMERLETLAGWIFGCCIGLGGLWAFTGHAFFAERVAESIGWAPSPFQWEIAMANLAFGVLGLFSAFIRGRFRLASAIGVNIYLLGCAVGHVRQMLAEGDMAVNNAGPILWVGDLLVPLLLLGLVLATEWKARVSPRFPG